MPRRERREWTDDDMLKALDLRDHEGLTAREIGQRMGRSKSSLVGMMNRVDKETDLLDRDGNQNGTMKRGWWKR